MASIRRILQTHSFFLLLNFISAIQISPLSPYLVNSFPSTPNATLNHFKVSDNGSVYIGAVNNLYHLSRNFDLQSKAEFRNGEERNVNKILEIIPFPVNKLISCGTGLNGTCQLRNLSDSSQVVRYFDRLTLTIAPGNDSTVGLVEVEASKRISLYVAQTVREEDRLLRRPISSFCLHKGDQNGCEADDSRQAQIISVAVEDDFIIYYVAVFSYQGYTYYVASQRRDATMPDSPIVPKMSRVCHNDESEDLSGFTEITLECKGKDGTLYSIAKSAVEVNDRMYVVFVKNIPDDGPNFKRTNQSALCMYEMEKLKTEFEDSIVNCSCNAEKSNSNYLSNSVCTPSDTELDCDRVKDFTCYPPSELGSRYPERSSLLGDIPGLPIFESSEASFSSLIITEIYQPISKHVAFIGTSEGTLFKVHFDEDINSTGFLYETLDVDYPVLRDTWISPGGDTAMFLTEKQLLEIKVANCSQYQTCEECIKPDTGEGDPYCGWCTLEQRCTRYEQCNSSSISSRWLGFNETICSAITDVTPSSLSVDVHSQTVVATVSQFPMPSNFNYSCHFGPTFTSEATLNNSLLSCLSPGNMDIPKIPNGEDNVEVIFAISSSEFNIPFVITSYAFFDCSRIRGCTDCVSKWPCDWCIDELRCMYNLNNTCCNSTSLRNDSSGLCPQVVPGKAVVVPSGVNREITVTARNLNLTSQKDYECVIELREENVSETFVSSASFTSRSNGEYNVTCSNKKYNYSLDKQEILTFLTLRWKNTGVYLDGTFNVTLYKCDVARPDCSRCLSNETTRPELQCGWCSVPQGFCAVEENCNSILLDECSDPPQISSVSPRSSPIEGGTTVEINGTDLGQRFSDIVNVSLAGVLCHHQKYSNKYQVGASLTCETGNSSTTGPGKVSLFIAGFMEAESEDIFSYNNPQISSFYPMIGPQSGGTSITINGSYLLTGTDISVDVGEDSCKIVEHSTTAIVCQNKGLAGNENSSENQTVSVKFDGHIRLAAKPFVYHQDPKITEVMPHKTIKSGGNLLTVTGEGFHLIQKPKIRFTIDGNSAEEVCFSQNGNEMEITCKSPSVVSLLEKRRKRAEPTAEGMVAVGFIMDGVTELLHWSQNNSVVFEYFRNPQYETFDVRDYQMTANNLLTLNGMDLNLASSEQDVTVYVGTELCVVKSLGTDTLICELPLQQPNPGDLYGNTTSNELPFIIIRHASLEFNIGYIRYKDARNILWYIVSGLGAFLIVMVIILIASACCIRRKKTQKIRDLELQVRNIQDSVSANLKTLFATLQTTMHDFEIALIEQTRVPLLDRRQYLLHMMFLGLDVEPSASPLGETEENLNLRAAMEEFSKLLYHKDFLKVLITTMDNTTGISIMDRANAGSLLSICLLQNGNLKLYTDLLLSLMQEHIEECDSKGKQRILFSRNDRMLEKLISNWVVIFLYEFLKKKAASEVYQLYEAIKYVCELGPIDAVSGKSQFSINDQQMLETQINFDELKLDVITNSVSGEKKPLKVLDVNSVTQVKERIISHNYRHLPYSERPSPLSLDLMWRVGSSGQLILRDDENPPGTLDKEWRKINTLKDLNVPSDSTFELVDKQETPNAETCLNKKAGQADNKGSDQPKGVNAASNYEILRSRRKSYDVNVAEGVRVWHLIKEDQEDFLRRDDENEPRSHKEIKEVVLPFLPATREYIQKYVDNLINAIFSVDDEADVPLSIKYLFQFFDREAQKEGKPDLAKAWKNNVLPLRYWSTIMANPQYVLDVGVYTYTHASLRILVQVIKDTCVGRAKVYKNKDFSPSRLLYSNFLNGYISKLDNYYLFVENLGRVDSEDLRQECKKVEEEFQNAFDLTTTQQKLFSFVADHQRELIDALEEDDVCSELSLSTKLQNVADMMRGQVD